MPFVAGLDPAPHLNLDPNPQALPAMPFLTTKSQTEAASSWGLRHMMKQLVLESSFHSAWPDATNSWVTVTGNGWEGRVTGYGLRVRSSWVRGWGAG